MTSRPTNKFYNSLGTPPALVHPSKEVLRAPSPAGEKNPATAPLSPPRPSLILLPNKTMKTKRRNFSQKLRRIFHRWPLRHDPMLVFNMSIFNNTDGWSRTFFKHEYARFHA
jgi:hypothetical protein